MFLPDKSRASVESRRHFSDNQGHPERTGAHRMSNGPGRYKCRLRLPCYNFQAHTEDKLGWQTGRRIEEPERGICTAQVVESRVPALGGCLRRPQGISGQRSAPRVIYLGTHTIGTASRGVACICTREDGMIRRHRYYK